MMSRMCPGTGIYPFFYAPYFREVGKHKICRATNLDKLTSPLIYNFTILGYSEVKITEGLILGCETFERGKGSMFNPW